MRGDHQNSAVGEHVIDDAHMAVDVVGENAGLHRAAFDFHRIKIVEQFAVAPFRIGAEHRRRHFAADACDERRRVADGVDDLAASGDDVAFARIAQLVARAIGGAHGVLVGKGQAVFPGVIGAQDISHVGAVAGQVGIDRRTVWIGFVFKAGVERGAVGPPDRLNEGGVAGLVCGAPFGFVDFPGFAGVDRRRNDRLRLRRSGPQAAHRRYCGDPQRPAEHPLHTHAAILPRRGAGR